MQFLIDDEIYLFQEFKFDETGKMHEFEENKNIKTKITEERERIKKVAPFLSVLFESAIENFTPFYENDRIYFFKLDETEKEFIKMFCKNFNKKLKIKFSIKFALNFRYIEEINKYYISIFSMNFIDFSSNTFYYQLDVTLKFENEYDILLGKRVRLKGKRESHFLYKNFQLKDIRLPLLSTIFPDYLKSLEKENPIVNEIIEDFKNEKESLNVPFDFQLLKEVRNKKELIELKLQKVKRKYKTYNCFNKMSLNGIYSLLKANKYLEEKDFPKYQNIDYKDFSYNENRRVKSFLKYLLEKTMVEEVDDENYLYDYISILIMLKGKYKINLNIKTNKKLISEHNKIYKIYKKAKFKKDKMVIEENNPFLKLELPKDIKILDTKKKLFDEGERMEHCAYTYLPYINNGSCMLYTYLKEGKRYTIEIIKKGKKFSLNQLKGYKNSEPPQEVIEYVENAIEQANIKFLENK